MDLKLKALKVVDLKNILVAAKVNAPAKATKSDLIARIIASKPALDAYNRIYPPDDDEVDWSEEQTELTPELPLTSASPQPVPAPTAAPTLAPLTHTTNNASPASPSVPPKDRSANEDELEKRRQRAARFGIPIVDPQQKKASALGINPKKLDERAARFGISAIDPLQKKANALGIDVKVLEKRAERFGIKPEEKSARSSTKRGAEDVERVDPEEIERRKKRAERFGSAT